MKLSRSLLYGLILIFIVGIVLICLVPEASAWSRIATGLITGSFVGAINTLVNYLHHRKEFFEKYSFTVLDLTYSLQEDFINFKIRMDDIEKRTRKDIIESDHKLFKEKLDRVRKFGEKYDNFYLKLESESYAPMFCLNKQRTQLLSELEDVVWNVKNLRVKLQIAYSFGMLAVKASEEEQKLVIGEPDEFYEQVLQANIDFRDSLAFNMNTLAELSEKIGKSLKSVLDKQYASIWEDNTSILKMTIDGCEIRDVNEDDIEIKLDEDKDK